MLNNSLSSPVGEAAKMNNRTRSAVEEYTGKEDREKINASVLTLVKDDDVLTHYTEGAPLGEGAFGRVWVGAWLRFSVSVLRDACDHSQARIKRPARTTLSSRFGRRAATPMARYSD